MGDLMYTFTTEYDGRNYEIEFKVYQDDIEILYISCDDSLLSAKKETEFLEEYGNIEEDLYDYVQQDYLERLQDKIEMEAENEAWN